MWHSANLTNRKRWTLFGLVAALVLGGFVSGSTAPLAANEPGQHVLQQPPTLPDPPILLSPPDGSSTCDHTPTFSWTRVKRALYYQVQIDDDPGFGSPIEDRKTILTSLTPRLALPAGTVYWRVRAASDEEIGAWAEAWSVSLLLPPAPPSLVAPPDGDPVCDRTPFLDWSTVDDATSYRVQVDDDPSFGSPELDESTSDSDYTLPKELAPGAYHWRVQAWSDCGPGLWSATFRFVVLARPAVPVLLAPPDGARTHDRRPTFSWSGVNGALSYRIQVSDDPEFGSTLVEHETSELSYRPTSDLPNGIAYWRVQAASACEYGDWSKPWDVLVFNNAPVANDDQYQFDEDSPVHVLNVLANDRDPDGDLIRIIAVTQPSHGSVSLPHTGDRLLYQPDPDFYGQDHLSYTIGDGHGGTDTAEVELNIVGINDPPVADAGADQSVLISTLVTLDGSGSYDPEGHLPLSYYWTQSGGPPVALSSGVVASPTFVAPDEPCTLTFELLVMDALGLADVTPDQTVVEVYTPTLYLTYLVTLGREFILAPDLRVEQIVATSSEVRAVIVNRGNAPVEDGFFVDLYVNPQPAPKAVNQTWDQFGDRGAVWGVTEPALSSLVPGGSITLEVGDRYYLPELSSLPGTLPAGTTLYVQVDSFNPATSYGTVLEKHEIDGGTYNNVHGPVHSTAAASGETTAVADAPYFR